MAPIIGILNYQMGNIFSIKNAVEFLGFNVSIIQAASDIQHVDKLIIPGVGAFGDAIHWINENGFRYEIFNFLQKERFILGICLGMQLLLDSSDEGGYHEGLGLIPGVVRKFPKYDGDPIPQMQWNVLKRMKYHPLESHVRDEDFFYFLHSYFVECSPEFILSTANYCGVEYCASLRSENVLGVQFHPEKSGEVGLALIKNFCLLND
jgi:imidazole glycerol-phosphate synthase subunit HisH